MKEFNTTGVCIPAKHYMVDISGRVKEIKKMVDAGKYFTINRARQYGKTTTLAALEQYLADQYDVISIDFQDATDAMFASENEFAKGLAQILCDTRDAIDIPINDIYYEKLRMLSGQKESLKINDLFRVLDQWCKSNEKSIIFIIDEVDSATNNQVFLDFLARLRSDYLKRERNPRYRTFQSVILVGVTDVRHLKSKIRDEDQHKVNSPWNIAADFNIDMSLSEEGIKGMLNEYEADHQTGMDTTDMARLIRDYTNGYPFLVSRICQLIDKAVSEKMKDRSEAWTRHGMDEAIKLILAEDNALFQSLTGKLENLPELRSSLYNILMEGTKLPYMAMQDSIAQMQMYGFIRNEDGKVKIDNRIFETLLYDFFLSDEEMKSNVFTQRGDLAKNQFVKGGKLDMRLVLERFIATYHEIYGEPEEKFTEKEGRKQFLLYLKPIINGTGNYYIEAETRDQTRTDVVVDYLGQQYIIELKIWRGERYNAAGEQQISDYLDYFGLETGYMLSFNFNQNKESGVKRVDVGGKVLYEGTV